MSDFLSFPSSNRKLKVLPKKSNEALLNLDRVSMKFMGLDRTFGSNQNPDGFLAVKKCINEGYPDQLWFHLRVKMNEWGYDVGFLDIDVYVPLRELKKLKELIGDES